MLTFATALQLAELIPLGMGVLAWLGLAVLAGWLARSNRRLAGRVDRVERRHRALFEAVNGLILVNDARESMEADMVDYLQRQEEGDNYDRSC